MRDDNIRAEHGFSVLEVLVASTILTVALLSLAQFLALATNATASAGRNTYAAVLAAGQLERLHAVTWESLASRVGESIEGLDRSGVPLRELSVPAYRRRSIVTPLPDDPANALVLQVVVIGRGEVARLTTLRTRTGP
jgi:prepilin-type N-terminal cleavage/methylation domain-containing protein